MNKILIICMIIMAGLIALLVVDHNRIESRAYINSLPDMPASEYQIPDVGLAITPEERDLIERVVSSEARGETLQGQMAVCEVILNRCIEWDSTVEGVLLAEEQFAAPYQGEVSELTKEAVMRIFDLGEVVFNEPVTHFATNDPYWADGKLCRGMIGRTKFYY